MRKQLALLLGVVTGGAGAHAAEAVGPETARAARVDTVYVAAPTGDRETDRTSILTALGDVEPGGTVQFAPGTYLMGGQIIRITMPRVTIVGHPEGTTLRGCHPDEFPMENRAEFGNACNGLELAGGWQTVRNLTFEHTFWALHVGCCWDSRPHMLPGEGGHLIEGNTFRSNSNAVRVNGYWSEPTVIQNNRFLNNWHSAAIYGNTVHLLDNDISAPEPEEVQWFGFPADAIHIARPQSLHESAEGVTRTCENNVVSGNRIDGVTEGIMMTADDPEITCRHNVIRDNTIIIRRAHPPVMPGFIRIQDEADSTIVGVPLALRGPVEDNLIEGNVIQGADGLGIEIRRASRNRIVNNTISRVARREPFPGNAIAALPVLGGDPEAWRDANGSGIWLSPGSDDNEIAGNVFEEIAGAAIFLEGDGNRVETRSARDPVGDLGSGNRVMRAGRPAAHLEALYRARTDSARTRFSAADVRFVSGMIAHHAQAVVMSRLATSRDASPAVRLLAERIITAQEDEIALLQQWLRERGQPVPEVDLTGATRTAHGPAHAAHAHGMLTGEQLRELEAATAREFDRLFLESMIHHHLGAITMVDELFSTDAAAQDPAVSRLAAAIQADQAAEIVRMRRMLAELSLTGRIR
jgi:parallel beta-helix repeat protein